MLKITDLIISTCLDKVKTRLKDSLIVQCNNYLQGAEIWALQRVILRCTPAIKSKLIHPGHIKIMTNPHSPNEKAEEPSPPLMVIITQSLNTASHVVWRDSVGVEGSRSGL